MKLDVQRDGRVAVIRLAGRLDLGTIATVDERVKELIAEGARNFVLRMIDVSDLSSSGLAKILSLKRTVEGRGGVLTLLEPSAVVEYVLNLAGLTGDFDVYFEEGDVLHALGAPSQRPEAVAAARDTSSPDATATGASSAGVGMGSLDYILNLPETKE